MRVAGARPRALFRGPGSGDTGFPRVKALWVPAFLNRSRSSPNCVALHQRRHACKRGREGQKRQKKRGDSHRPRLKVHCGSRSSAGLDQTGDLRRTCGGLVNVDESTRFPSRRFGWFPTAGRGLCIGSLARPVTLPQWCGLGLICWNWVCHRGARLIISLGLVMPGRASRHR